MQNNCCLSGRLNQNKLSCRKFVIRHLRIFVSDVRGHEQKEMRRFRIKCGMTPLFNNSGFTLIELLVVVLIIGILAAVAVPQYQKAVDKARLVQLIVLNKAIREAEERYYLANGSYTNDFNVLDVGFAATEESGHYWKLADGTSFYLASGGLDQSIYTYSPLLPGVSLRSVYNRAGYGDTRDGRMLCYADKNNARANRACKSIGTGCHLVDEGRNLCFVSQQ